MRAFIPTPDSHALELGPLTIHYYALCIIAGVAIAIWLGDKRFRKVATNGKSIVSEVAIYALPMGVIGGRIYHVITSPAAYFGPQGQPIDAFKIWQGGLGIWGAISLGTIGAWWRYRQLAKRIELPPFTFFLDALAPGVLLAQAVGRFGNWFNGELFGRPLEAPWALEIPLSLRPFEFKDFSTFHPTFLYEAIWCTLLALLLIYLGRRLKPGQTFALYILGYCFGRFFIEIIRIDAASMIFGVRVNVWVSALVAFGAALTYFKISKKVELG